MGLWQYPNVKTIENKKKLVSLLGRVANAEAGEVGRENWVLHVGCPGGDRAMAGHG